MSTFIKSLTLFFGALGIASSALAQNETEIYVRGSGRLFPIALPVLCSGGSNNKESADMPRIIQRDLDLSGYFEVIKPASYIETPGKCGAQENTVYSDWSVIGAEGLVKGEITTIGNRIRAQLYLHDVQKRVVVLAKEYEGDASQASRIAHKFANEIMKFFTGEYGVFGTQVAFSSRVGRFKELFVMDMDGSNIRQLTNERGLALSASWDSSGAKLVYTSYRNRVPDLFTFDVVTKVSRQLTKGPDMEIGAHFLPNGQILTSRTEGSDGDIILLNPDGSRAAKLTPPNRAIDVSPVPSPDGREIIFCSNRGGGPQIYRMGVDGSSPRRISFVTSNYCTSPAWSPKGDKIAFVCRADGDFQMFVADADGSNAVQLTSGGSNEDPDWSPDGRYLVYSTTSFGKNYNLALMRVDGSNVKQLTNSRGGDFEPTWNSLLP